MKEIFDDEIFEVCAINSKNKVIIPNIINAIKVFIKINSND